MTNIPGEVAEDSSGQKRRGGASVEFVALMAMLSAMTAFGIDAMLPALPEIGADLSPADPSRAQLLVSSFILGMGIGTFFSGPLSDALGRKPVIAGGIALYILGALLSWRAPGLESVLAGRLLMGLGAAGPRVAVLALVRDRHEGPEMARIMSFVMMTFMIVPALAPSIGAFVMNAAGWRAIFPFFAGFGAVALLWFTTRQAETLPPARRRPLRIAPLRAAVAEVLSLPLVRMSILIQTLIFTMQFALLSSIQGIFDQAYGRGAEFPLWFAMIAAAAAVTSLMNARLVRRIGIIAILRSVIAIEIVLAAGMVLAVALPLSLNVEFGFWVVWAASLFLQGSLTIGNLNALAMQPLGHIAGMAASVISAISTITSALLAAPIGLAADGAPQVLALAVLCLSALAFFCSFRLR